jgi:hypothetical protein
MDTVGWRVDPYKNYPRGCSYTAESFSETILKEDVK